MCASKRTETLPYILSRSTRRSGGCERFAAADLGSFDDPVFHVVDREPVAVPELTDALCRCLPLDLSVVDAADFDTRPPTQLDRVVAAHFAYTGRYLDQPFRFGRAQLNRLTVGEPQVTTRDALDRIVGTFVQEIRSSGPLPASRMGQTRLCRPGRAVSAVYVWALALPDVLDAEDLALLDQSERSRARRFRDPRQGAWYGTAHATVRHLLAGALGVDPSDVRLDRAPCTRCANANHGPPRIVEPACDLHISTSRSRDIALVALSTAGPVGIDVESRLRVGDMHRLVEATMTGREKRTLLEEGEEVERIQRFLQCWTRKEAVLKAAGVGIVVDLRSIDTGPLDRPRAEVNGPVELPPTRWLVEDLRVGSDLCAAIARPAGAAVQIIPQYINLRDVSGGRAGATPGPLPARPR